MQVVQALLATVIPLLTQQAIDEGHLIEVLGALSTIRWIDAYLSTVDPPADYATLHEQLARSVSAMAIGAALVQDGLSEDDNGKMTVGIIACETAGEGAAESLTALFTAMGLSESDALVPIEYGGADEDDSTDTTGASGSVHEVFTGVGDDVATVFLASGLVTIDATHRGEGNFIIIIYGPDGFQDLVVNEIGDYDGRRAIPVPSSGTYTLDIQASGSWRVAVDQ